MRNEEFTLTEPDRVKVIKDFPYPKDCIERIIPVAGRVVDEIMRKTHDGMGEIPNHNNDVAGYIARIVHETASKIRGIFSGRKAPAHNLKQDEQSEISLGQERIYRKGSVWCVYEVIRIGTDSVDVMIVEGGVNRDKGMPNSHDMNAGFDTIFIKEQTLSREYFLRLPVVNNRRSFRGFYRKNASL